jgi:hypothetical protein
MWNESWMAEMVEPGEKAVDRERPKICYALERID